MIHIIPMLFLLAALALPAATQWNDDGSLPSSLPPVSMDGPPGTKLKEFSFSTPRVHGLTMIKDSLYGIYRSNMTKQEIYEFDTTTGAKKATITLAGYPSNAWLYGLGWDSFRQLFVMGDTTLMGLALADMNGKITTFVSTPGDRNVGAAYDPYRDGYWVCAWNTNSLKLYDAKSLPAVLMTINLAASGCTSCAGVAFSPVNDLVYTNSRSTQKGYVFDPGTGKLLLSYSGLSGGYGSAWWDRWQCPVVAEETLWKITYRDAGYPRVDAQNTVQFGKTLQISWKAGSSGGKIYKAAAAFTERVAGIRFLNRYLPIATDDLFFLSLVMPSIFSGFEGSLDANGTATGSVIVPNIPALAGYGFSIAWVVVDPGALFGIEAFSGPWQVSITK